MRPLFLLLGVAVVSMRGPVAARAEERSGGRSFKPRVDEVPAQQSPWVSKEEVDSLYRRIQEAGERSRTSAKGLASSPVKMDALTSISEPLTVTIHFHTEGNDPLLNPLSPVQVMSLENGIAEALAAEGIKPQKVSARADGRGELVFRSPHDFGEIRLEVFPGPSARGSVDVPRRYLFSLLGKRIMTARSETLGERLVLFEPEFTARGDALIPASRVPAFVYAAKAAHVNFWSAAEVLTQGAGGALEEMLKDSEVDIGPLRVDDDGVSAGMMGLTLSGRQLTYQPELPLPLGLKVKMRDKVVLKEFLPPSLKTPEGGLIVSSEFSAQGLKGSREGLAPAGPEASSLFFNGAGVAEGEKLASTTARYQSVVEPSYGHSGGGRGLRSGESWFCEGLFAGEQSPAGIHQDILYDRFETADGDRLLLRMDYVKVAVSLSLSKSQIREGGERLAHLLFYICPGPPS